MHIVTDANDNEPGFTRLVPVPEPETRYTLGLPWGGTTVVRGSERIADRFYKGFVLSYNPKPIPTRAFDYDFVHEDYDGPGDNRCGAAESPAGCRYEIDLLLEERE